MLFLISSCHTSAQDFSAVYTTVDGYSKTLSLSEIALNIRSEFHTEEEKAAAIFRWVTTQISYNIDLAEKMTAGHSIAFAYNGSADLDQKEKAWKKSLVDESLKNRSAICHGYAVLTQELAVQSGLECEIITGTLKSDPDQIGNVNLSLNHAWNVIKVNNIWKLLDPTLGAGYISQKTGKFEFDFNDGYLFTAPERLALSHFARDHKWRYGGLTEKKFADLPVYFGFYFRSNLKITSPSDGVHSVSSFPVMRLRIEGISEDDYVQYVVSNSNKFIYIENPLDPYISIPLQDHSGELLSIFVNGKIMCIYKLVQ